MMKTIMLIKYLLDEGLDNRIMNNIRIDFLSKIHSENGSLDTEEFIKIFRTISKTNLKEMEEKVIEYLEDPDLNIIRYSKFSEFVDFYQYLPLQIKKDKNLSQELYYILTSNKYSKFGEDFKTDQEHMGLKEALDFLWLKIEERFHKVANAFRYFDINNNGTIQLKEFEIGVHKLSTRFTRQQIKQMFNYIDTNQDGDIQYIEFCELCDECRRGIDPYKIDKKLKRGENLVNKFPNRMTMTNSFRIEKEDDDIISSSLASFKRKQKLQTLLPSELNQNHTYGIKTPVPENINSVLTYEPLSDYLNYSKMREEKINSK